MKTAPSADHTAVLPQADQYLALTASLHPQAGGAEGELIACSRDKYYQVGGLAANLLMVLADSECSLNVLRFRLMERCGQLWDEAQFAAALQRLRNCSLVAVEPATSCEEAVSGTTENASRRYMAVRVPLFRREMLQPATHMCARLLSPAWMCWIGPTLLLGQIVFFALYFSQLLTASHFLGAKEFTWLLAGNYVGLLMHELGHASACVRCGIRHGPIGVSIYLIFPVFYTDVSEAWKLPSRRRMIVDSAGMYVSLWLATIAALLYLGTGNFVFGILAILYDITIIANLNPFIRMDAYWLFSDAIGVPNLMSENRSLTKWLLFRLVGVCKTKPRVLSSAGRVRNIYLVYYLLFLVFIATAVAKSLVWYPHLLAELPQRARDMRETISIYGISSETIYRLVALFFPIIPIVGISAYGTRRAVAIVRRAQKVFSERMSRGI